jgi:8-hydroxy-5-deazaflavin:NADPH oxidoreductase
MNIAIIGTGNVGKALAGAARRGGHQVTMTSRDKSKAGNVAKEVGAKAAESNAEAVKPADIVILAVPAASIDAVVADLDQSLDGKVVVDVSNRVDAKNPGNVLDGTSVTERIQSAVPRAHVVKAFNTLFATRMANPQIDGMALDAYVAADDENAKKKVLELAQSMGLRALDAGPLPMARVLEGMALLNISLQIRNQWPWQSGFKMIGPTPDKN